MGTADLVPPPQYDHPYAGRTVTYSMPFWDVNKECHGIADARIYACASQSPDPRNPGKMVCRVILPRESDIGAKYLAHLLKHEIGHCNGWTENHEDGRF